MSSVSLAPLVVVVAAVVELSINRYIQQLYANAFILLKRTLKQIKINERFEMCLSACTDRSSLYEILPVEEIIKIKLVSIYKTTDIRGGKV